MRRDRKFCPALSVLEKRDVPSAGLDSPTITLGDLDDPRAPVFPLNPPPKPPELIGDFGSGNSGAC